MVDEEKKQDIPEAEDNAVDNDLLEEGVVEAESQDSSQSEETDTSSMTDVPEDLLVEAKKAVEEDIQSQVEALAAEIASTDVEQSELPDWALEAIEEDQSAVMAGEDVTLADEEEEEDAVAPSLLIPKEAEEDEDEEGRSWYVVHCYSGYENKVRHNLEQRIESMGMKDLIFDVVVPTEEEIEVKEGKRRSVERRVFPGYILVNMIMTEESWYVVRNTPGVTSFVGMGNDPVPLRPEEVASIIKRMEADAPRIKVTFRQGERVRIIDGPFNDFRGTVDEIDMERAKVRVMVNFFGRETPVELDFLQVEKA
jgi:transcriptional antiterminator NusG